MPRPLSPIHAPLEVIFPEHPPEEPGAPPVPAKQSRIARLAGLDSRILAGRKHSLGAGGASGLFAAAVQKALVDEMAEQLREGPFEGTSEDGEVREWALEIIDAFREE